MGHVKTIVNSTESKDGYKIFHISVSSGNKQMKYQIYVFDKDLPLKNSDLTKEKLEQYAVKQMESWLNDSDGKLPKDKYRVLINGGKITTSDIKSFLSVQKETSDLIRTNVTISAPLFEWAKSKAQRERTSFSDLVSRGLLTLKDSDKEIDAWFKEQGVYFRKKLGDLGSFEIFHYLPNSYSEFNTNTLRDAIEQAEIKRTGWPIGTYLITDDERPYPQQDGIKAEYSNSGYLSLDYWYAKNKGEFYFSRNLESDSSNGEAKPKTCLYFDTLIWRVAEALEHCLAYYQLLNIDDDERVKMKISLYGLTGRFLSAWNPMRAFTLRHHISGSDKSTWEIETELHSMKENLDDIIYEATKKLLVMFDFFVPSKEVLLDILNREYRNSKY